MSFMLRLSVQQIGHPISKIKLPSSVSTGDQAFNYTTRESIYFLPMAFVGLCRVYARMTCAHTYIADKFIKNLSIIIMKP